MCARSNLSRDSDRFISITRVHALASENKMDASNLALIFSAAILGVNEEAQGLVKEYWKVSGKSHPCVPRRALQLIILLGIHFAFRMRSWKT